MLEVRRLFEPLYVPVKILQPFIQYWVIMPDCPQIALEMLHVHDIEPDQ